jgi:hypothetical protein
VSKRVGEASMNFVTADVSPRILLPVVKVSTDSRRQLQFIGSVREFFRKGTHAFAAAFDSSAYCHHERERCRLTASPAKL